MNKFICLFYCSYLFLGMKINTVQAQTGAVSNVNVNIIDPSKAAQVKFISSFSQIVSNNSIVPGNPVMLVNDNGKIVASTIQNLARFSITNENENSFSVTLPHSPIILKNTNNTNTLQVEGWNYSSQPQKSDLKKNIWVVQLNAILKLGSNNEKQEGSYIGTYPVTFVYN